MALYLISVDYDSEKKSVYMKFYDEDTGNIHKIYDNKYKAYCLSNTEEHFKQLKAIKTTPVTKYDALNDKLITMYQGFFNSQQEMKATKKYSSILTENGLENPFWENGIDINKSYTFDNQLLIGMPYKLTDNKCIIDKDINIENRIDDLLILFEEKNVSRELLELFEYKIPYFKRASIDIEVLNENKKMPLATVANYPVLCVCIYTYEGKRICLMLLQPNKKLEQYPNVDELYVFGSETDLLLKTFEVISHYPMMLTFNGDEFDFLYLKNRAHRLGIPPSKIPFHVLPNKKVIYIENSLHIDLYKFFNITAIQNYAFQGRYKTVSLDKVSNALLNKQKLNQEHKTMGEMDYNELINYCMQDAMLTYELTTFDDELVMNLITLIARISRMSIEECSRRAVGAWIGQYLFNAHRKMNYLIPRVEDILRVKGKPATKSKVKGKQYEGALVVKPKAGIPFKMKGLDFGSLYPSVKKNYNIGYATINCPHPNCIDNKFADLPHHICKKNRAIESIFVGALRDLRLNYYKKQSKNKELTQSQRNTYKAIEQVIKVIVNGDYGVSASESFAFYCPVASEEIAGISRSVTMQTIEHAKELGINIHYGDTDSLFISDTNPEIIKSLQNWAFSKFGIELEEDKVFKFMGFSTRKKNYFGVKENGDIDIKGLTGGKKHVPNFYKLYYSRIIKEIQKIQTEDDIPNAKNQISAIIKEGYNNLKKRKWGELSELAFHITSSKMPEEYKKGIPQHVKAIKQLIESGYQYELGTEISIIKTLKNKNRESVMPLQLAKPVHVNVDAYIKQFESMVSQIIDIFGIKWDDILGTTKMTSYLYD